MINKKELKYASPIICKPIKKYRQIDNRSSIVN